MKQVTLTLIITILLTGTSWADRVLRAKHVTTDKWFQRVDSGNKGEAEFKAEVAAQFGVPASDVLVIVTQEPASSRLKAIAEMAAGSHLGRGVIAAPPPSNPQPDLTGFFNSLRVQFPSGRSQDVRLGIVLAKTKSWEDLQDLIIEAFNGGAITLAQYNNIKSAATAYNIPVTLP